MAASSALTAAAPRFCCLTRRGGLTDRRSSVVIRWPNVSETRKYRTSWKRCNHKISTFSEKSNPPFRDRQLICKATTTMEVALANETLLTGEEAVISAAVAEAVALARAAVEVARDAAQLFGTTDLRADPVPMLKTRPNPVPMLTSISALQLERTIELEPPVQEAEKNISIGSGLSVTVGSTRLQERRARRARAAERAAENVVPVKVGSAAKRKRRGFKESDYKDPIRMFKRIAGTYKPLTVAEERELSEGVQDLLRLKALEKELKERNGQEPTFAQWAAAARVDKRTLRKRVNHGMFCKEKMIRSNIRLVISIAKKFMGAGLAFEDIVQEGCLGLVKGVEKFDGSKGFKFSTYAHWWIKQAIRRSLSQSSRLIYLPFNMVNASYRVKEAIKQLNCDKGDADGKKLDQEEIARVAGLSKKTVQAVLMLPKAPISFDRKIGIDNNMKLSEVIPCREQETPEFLFNKEYMKSGLDMVLDTLNPREKLVVRWRYGLEDGRTKTLQEIGDIIGVSRERVRQIELCAFRKLKSKKRIEILQKYMTK